MAHHFFRLKTVNDTSEEFPVLGRWDRFRPSGDEEAYPAFEKKFEEITLDPPWPHCRMYRAPEIPRQYWQIDIFRIREGVEFPDIWADGTEAIVSEKARRVIESFDDFGHQFYATEVWDWNRKPIDTTPRFRMNVRRFLEIDALGGKVENDTSMFRPRYEEKQFLPTLQKDEVLRQQVAQLPLWRHKWLNEVIYLSDAMLRRLRDERITGLSDYSDHFDGRPREAIARFM